MAYVDMAHSHVQRMLREACGTDEVVQDEDGDYPFRHNTAAWFASVHPQGHLVRIWSRAVTGVRPTAAVLREVNATNVRMLHSRAYLQHDSLVIEAIVPVEGLEREHLAALCHEVGCTADRLGELLATVHGGVLADFDA